jgi:polyhydroxyalkanoate synthesis regulator phasin
LNALNPRENFRPIFDQLIQLGALAQDQANLKAVVEQLTQQLKEKAAGSGK